MPTKPQRLLDLLAFLVGRRLPVSVEEIMESVPSYGVEWREADEKEMAAVRRKFERDKDELRALGIPLETVSYGFEGEEGYRIRREDFYLPYLKLLREEAGGSADEGRSAHPPARPPPRSSSRGQAGAPTVELPEADVRDAVDALRSAASLPAFPFEAEGETAGFEGLRIFRLDRVLEARIVEGAEPFEVPEGFDPRAVIDGGRVYARSGGRDARVRYGREVAAWIREWVEECWPEEARDGAEGAEDRHGDPPAPRRFTEEDGGRLVLDHPVSDPRWLVRHVLSLAGAAEVLEPEELRKAVREGAEAVMDPPVC